MAHPTHAQDLIDEFAFLDDWEQRYMHVIEMGKALAPLSDAEYAADHKVNGCVSQVWLVNDGIQDGRLYWRGDSDAHIVKGLVAVVLALFSGQTPADIRNMDAKAIFKDLGLSEHLSAQRSNGLASMIAHIQADAKAAI